MESLQDSTPDYPERIMPQEDYHLRMDIDVLNSINPYLQRKSDLPLSSCCVDGDLDRVTTAAFGQRGLVNMSVNIFGGLFQVGDERWHQKVSKEDAWKGGAVDIDTYEGRYEWQDEKVSVYFSFDKAHNVTWNFPRKFADKNQFSKYRDAIIEGLSPVGDFSKDVTYFLSGHSECNHDPNPLNYWHMEIASIIDSNPVEYIVKDNSNYQKMALRAMIEAIRVFASLRLPTDIPRIPEICYINKRPLSYSNL